MSSRKTLAIALSAGLILSGTAGFGAAESFAQPAGDQTQANQAQYSLTVVKRKGAEEERPDYDGSEIQAGLPASDLPEGQKAGFTFKVEQVTPAAGDQAKNDASQATTVKEGFSGEKTTDESGTVKFDNLPAGVYRVTEIAVPADSGFVAGKPFLVSVPMTNKAGNGLINDVFVYPKNTQAGIEKEVVDADKHGGQEYTYVIKSAIPAPATGERLVSYTVEDELNAQLRAPEAKGIKVKLGTEWATGTDVDAANYDVNIVGQKVTLEFNETGRTLLAANTDKQVLTQITTTAPENAQVVPNKSTLIFNNGSGTGDVQKDSNEVKTYWGKLNIKKVGEDNTTPLQGAEFQIVRCEAGQDNTYTKVAGSEPLTINGQSKWTTGQEGTLTVTGIHASDFENNGAVDPKSYCAQETKAPTGFRLDDTLHPFTLNVAGATTEAGVNTEIKADLTIKNTSNDRFLPNTGGMGIAVVALLSLAVIAGGILLARRNAA